MTAQQTEPHLEIFAALVEELEQSPPCDIGRAGNPPPGVEPCPHQAEYSCRVHQCGYPAGAIVLLCEGHVTLLVQRTEQLLEIHGGPYSEKCGHQVRSVEDFIWEITPLR